MNHYIITQEHLMEIGSGMSAILAVEIQLHVLSHPYNPQVEREKVLEALKKDLQTRFVSSSNQWSKGRNSGPLECCNIIDEELRQSKEGEL